MENSKTALQGMHVGMPAAEGMVGSGRAFRAFTKMIEIVAPTDSTVLILGETGVGKEVIAREIHRRSRRKEQALVRVNCASVPRELYESEFFGHTRGAFTGAIQDRVGRLEAADRGTLFLDEIGEIPIDLQGKLLRALQERQYERVGDERTRTVDVRIIAATNRDLKQEMEAGRFRQDLYYRLNVFPIEVTPLRSRKEDIASLARHFLNLLIKELKCAEPRLTQAGLAKLERYDWPGNVRELKNVIERAIILAQGEELDFDLPATGITPRPVPLWIDRVEAEFLTESEIRRRERDNLLIVLQKSGWRVGGAKGAAELMGMRPTTLISRIRKMGLRCHDQASPERSAPGLGARKQEGDGDPHSMALDLPNRPAPLRPFDALR